MSQYAINRRKLKMAQCFVPGDCHVCRQRGVKVRKLSCNRHNYCMMCAEFMPRLVRGDFRCEKCTKERNQYQNRNKEDCFLATRTDGRTIRNKPLEKCPYEFDTDDSDDDNDLEGNNQEWDHLLESLTKPATPVKTPPSQEDSSKYYPKLIPRKASYLHLTLPSAHDDVTERRKLPNTNLICNTVTQLLNSGTKLPGLCAKSSSFSSSDSQSNSPASSRERLIVGNYGFTGHADQASFTSTFQTDPSEIERNTSPCKGLRPRSGQSWYEETTDGAKSPLSESEELLEMIGEIHGPEFDTSSSSRSGSNSSKTSLDTDRSYDDFWDSKIG